MRRRRHLARRVIETRISEKEEETQTWRAYSSVYINNFASKIVGGLVNSRITLEKKSKVYFAINGCYEYESRGNFAASTFKHPFLFASLNYIST